MTSTVLITGAARRIGRHLALDLARSGWHIALHYHGSKAEAESAAEAIRALGVTCTLFACDLGDTSDLTGFIDRVADACPTLDTLINSASIFHRAHLLETPDDLLDRQWAINFRAPFVLIRDFARRVRKGNVINLLDTKITRDHTPYCAYSITKKALHDLTRLAASELGPDIRVNGVAPGLILPSADLSDADFQRMAEKLPLKRPGSPEKIAQAVRFLLDHDYITGQCLLVDGGEHLI